MEEYKVSYIYHYHDDNINQIVVKYFNRWFKNDEIYSEPYGPAYLEYNPNSIIWSERWYKNGQLHREDGPAIIDYNPHGIKCKEVWCKNGKIHREDGPAHIEKPFNSFKYIEIWYKNDKIHRENDKPARIEYYNNGSKYYEYWYLNGLITRLHNYATITYEDDGTILAGWFYIGSVRFYIKNDISKFIKLVSLFRKKIWRYKIKKRKEMFEILKDTQFNRINGPDICRLVSTFVY